MAIIKEYMGLAQIFLWRLIRPPKFNHGGAFVIRAKTIFSPQNVTPRDETNVVVTVPFFAGDLLRLLEFFSFKELLREAFLRLIFVGSCVNLDALVQKLAHELFCGFRFGPQFLNRDDTRLIFALDLDVYVEKTQSDHFNPEILRWIGSANEQLRMFLKDDRHNFPEEIKEIEDNFKHNPKRIHQIKLKKGSLREVGLVLEVDRFPEFVKNHVLGTATIRGLHVQVKDCSICSRNLFQVDEFFVKAHCGHMFHRSCLFNSLISTDSCPVCASAFKIFV